MATKKKLASKKKSGSRRAVIDIGSNSVRLVIYDGPLRAPIAIFNEKALCGLGREMTDKSCLNPQAVVDTLMTLTRFRRVLKEHGDPSVQAIATAAVREAKDGEDFVDAIKEIGFDVRVISGVEEAVLAAQGVVSFEPGATGLAGDMGGGSLELVALTQGEIKETASLAVGPLSLMRVVNENVADAQAIIQKEIDNVGFLKPGVFETIYAVGGAWRAIARIHMGLQGYPLSVLHHYEMTTTEAADICDVISHQSRRSLEDIPGIPRRRLDTLPYASLVLEMVLNRVNAKRIVISSGGVREGLLYEQLSSEARLEDPLIAACKFYAQRLAPAPAYGEFVFPVIEPLFVNEDSISRRQRYATCILVDIGAYFHPDLRARQAFDTALSAPFVGISHEARIWSALALYRRHEGRTSPWPSEETINLLSPEARASATKFGLALRFLAAFSPKVGKPLEGCVLEFEPGRLIFRAPADRETLMGETPRKRLASLAVAFEAEPVEIYEA